MKTKLTAYVRESDCDGMAQEFTAWIRENHPFTVEVVNHPSCILDDDGRIYQGITPNDLWEEFCNS